MPYFAPEAPMPMTSCAPKLAERKANPATQAGMERPARKKSVLVRTERFSPTPIPRTKTKYTPIMVQSMALSMNDASRAATLRILEPHSTAHGNVTDYNRKRQCSVEVPLIRLADERARASADARPRSRP